MQKTIAPFLLKNTLRYDYIFTILWLTYIEVLIELKLKIFLKSRSKIKKAFSNLQLFNLGIKLFQKHKANFYLLIISNVTCQILKKYILLIYFNILFIYE